MIALARTENKVYLPCLEIGGGCFSIESSVCVEDYQGKSISGSFFNSMIRDGMLEVKVLVSDDDLAVVAPVCGQEFSEYRAITVKKEVLRYV